MFIIKKIIPLQILLFLGSLEGNFSKVWLVGGDLLVRFASTSDFDFIQNDKIQFSAHLPGFQEVDDSDRTPDLLIEHTYCKSCKTALQQGEKKFLIRSQWAKSIPPDFIHLLYGACRIEWIKKNILPVHAACIGNDSDGYVLLIGLPGSGKTSMTLYNVLNNGLKVFSGDKTLIRFNDNGEMEGIAGTKTITVRMDDIPKWESLKKVDENIFGDRLTFQLTSDYYSAQHAVPIKQIYFISLRDGALINSRLTPLSALHILYPFFLDKQREDVLLNGNETFLDGSIPKDIKKEFINNLHAFLQDVPVYNIAGSLNEMSLFIQEKSGFRLKAKASLGQKKILFGICGIGNGHLNRELPIILSLLEQGHKIMIFTYGEGLTFFKDKLPEQADVTIVHVENPYLVGTLEGIDFEKTALIDKNKIDFTRINSLAIDRAIKEFGKPDLVVSDYEMVAAQYAYAQHAPLLTLDQQSKYLVGDFKPDLHGTSYKDEIERLSMFFPKAAKRIAVSFFNVKKISATYDMFVEVHPPILRPEIIAAKEKIFQEKQHLLVYVTAQQLGEQPIDQWITIIKTVLPKDFEAHIFLPKRITLPENDANLHFYHHGDNRFDLLLFTCRGVITTAGHTLLSEAMYLEKPVYAVPLPLYEQQLNAETINRGGFGVSTQDLTEEALRTFVGNLKTYKKNIHDDIKFLLKGTGNATVMHEIDAMLRESS